MPVSIETRKNVELLCWLAIARERAESACNSLYHMTAVQRDRLLLLARQHHVNVRVLQVAAKQALTQGAEEVASWATTALQDEKARQAKALKALEEICGVLEREGCPITVIKSLDHLPDFGTDFDLYTPAEEKQIIEILVSRFNATEEPRSWGDRLAHKWNFRIPGMSESIEVHVGRLGQTGEHIDLARRFNRRRVRLTAEEFCFFVPSAEERIIAATLQRIYRHFFFRICDIVNAGVIIGSQGVDFRELEEAASQAGIWPGVATYLTVVSDLLAKYDGGRPNLSERIVKGSWFGAERLYVSNIGYLRFPIFPHAAGLYLRQLGRTAATGNIAGSLRLSLLPPLASVAGVATKLVGSDKGIW